MYIRNIPVIIICLIVIHITGCVTPKIIEFEQVQVGQDKDTVLSLVGNPYRTDRKEGLDRWTYFLYDHSNRIEKVLHFNEGTLVYKGDPIPAIISADEQDAINLKQEIELSRLSRSSEKRSDENKNSKNGQSSAK